MFNDLPFLEQLPDIQTSTSTIVLFLLFFVMIAIIYLVTMWLIFEKAGQPGWKNLIPIYNTVVFLGIAGKPWWWIFLLGIPIVNIICILMFWNSLGKSFGKGIFFRLGLIFFTFLFLIILAFDSSMHEDLREQAKRKFHETGQFDMSQYLPAES